MASVDDMDPDVSLVSVSVPEDIPIVVKKPIGSGWIYTCLTPFYGGGKSRGMYNPVHTLLAELLQPRQHVTVEQGPPTLFWTSAKWNNRTTRVVSVSNNADFAWRGSLSVRLDDVVGCGSGSSAQCVDVWAETPLPCQTNGQGGVLLNDMTVEAHGAAVVEVSCRV